MGKWPRNESSAKHDLQIIVSILDMLDEIDHKKLYIRDKIFNLCYRHQKGSLFDIVCES